MSKPLMKKIKLGHKETPCVETKKTKDILYYPSMYISSTQLPLEGEDVGKEFIATVKLDFTGLNESKKAGKKVRFNYDFDVKEITFEE